MEFRDYYATLGVERTASDDDIRKAYRKLARQFHPDLNPGDQAAEARFKEINEAHEVLGNKENRKKYDELGANWRQQAGGGDGHGGQPGADWSAHFGGGGRGGGRPMSAEEINDLFGQGDPFSDFFHTFFGGRAGGARGGGGARASRRPAPGRDVEQPVELTLEEAFHGTSRRLRLSGSGTDATIEVRIPAGVKDGARVRAAGKGLPSSSGGPAGDLYLRVRLQPHAAFERRGNDLHTTLSLPLTTAVLGGEAAVRTLEGTEVRLKVPEMTPAGRVFRVRGRGMPQVGKHDERGDLYAAAELKLPDALSEEARGHYEALRTLETAQEDDQ